MYEYGLSRCKCNIYLIFQSKNTIILAFQNQITVYSIIKYLFIRQINQKLNMGNLIPNHQILIDVLPPSSKLFNFHNDTQLQTSYQTLVTPSYIHMGDNQLLQYSERSKYIDRHYEINLTQHFGQPTLELKKMSENSHQIWKALTVDQQVQLCQGDNIRLADIDFTVKKICRNYSDLHGVHDNFNMTLSQIDLNQNLNLGSPVRHSRNLKKSKFIERSMFKNESIASVDYQNENAQFCRVCFCCQSTDKNPLLSICKCSGTIKNIHYGCLKAWITARSKTRAGQNYEYFEYDLSCDLCKFKIDKIIQHKGKKYVVYSETLMHPPYVVLAYRNQSHKVKEFVINFYNRREVNLGRGRCDVVLPDRLISMQHCEFIYEDNRLFIKNYDPTYGTLVQVKESCYFTRQNDIQLMISNHLVRIKRIQSSSCCNQNLLKLKIITVD